MKKKILFSLLLVLITTFFSGCAAFTRIEYISDWSAQYDEDNGVIQVFFGLQDENQNYTSAYADVDVRIEDNAGNVLYENTTSVEDTDFATFSNTIKGDRYLAEFEIPISKVSAGVSSDGKVYITVSNEDKFYFEEVAADLYDGLPIKDIKLITQDEPISCSYSFPYVGTNTYEISNINYGWSADISTCFIVEMTITKVKGSKDLSYGTIDYKLYDSDGYIVDDGAVFCKDINVGEKYKDYLNIYDLIPGEEYTLVFGE